MHRNKFRTSRRLFLKLSGLGAAAWALLPRLPAVHRPPPAASGLSVPLAVPFAVGGPAEPPGPSERPMLTWLPVVIHGE